MCVDTEVLHRFIVQVLTYDTAAVNVIHKSRRLFSTTERGSAVPRVSSASFVPGLPSSDLHRLQDPDSTRNVSQRLDCDAVGHQQVRSHTGRKAGREGGTHRGGNMERRKSIQSIQPGTAVCFVCRAKSCYYYYYIKSTLFKVISFYSPGSVAFYTVQGNSTQLHKHFLEARKKIM